MAKDAELERLKAAQDLAFQRKQDAFQAQDRAWKRRSSARDTMNQAFEAKQRAYEAQNASWQEVERIRSANGPRIDSLNAEQEREYQNMGAAFDRASAAYNNGDRAAAPGYADEGRLHKARSQACVTERRRLVQEIRDARERHNTTKPAFERAKEVFASAKRTFDQAKAEHERKQTDFNQAKANFDKAAKAFKDRLEKVKAENKKRRDDKRSVAEKAGVPYQYRDNVWVSKESGGTVNIYFGGVGKPNGPGHGHYVMDAYGNVTYKRDPHEPHGAQNFTDAQRDYYDIVATEASTSGDFGFRCKFRGYDAHVESNVNRQGREKIDIYYGPNGPFGSGHHHAVAYREDPFTFVYDEYR
jgi:hypothetical protein